MKKFLVVFISAAMFVSCLGDGPMNSQQYNMVATFESVNDYEMTEQFGSDSLYFDTRYGTGLTWADVAFLHKTTEDKQTFLGGFILSHLKGKVYSQGDEPDKDVDLYRVNAPADSSRTYSVFKKSSDDMMPVHDIGFMLDEYGTCLVKVCKVAVPFYVAYAAQTHFKDGDALVIKFTGYRDDKKAAEASFNLITCEGGVVNVPGKWVTFDLSTIGDIQYIDIDVQSTNPNVPEVFCMDNFGAAISVQY